MHGVYFITGKLGAGKGLVSVCHMIEKYIQKGRRVVTNFDLFFDKYPNKYRRELDVIRVPDKPTAQDLYSVGRAYQGSYDENKNGMILLDECASWFNSRTWNEKGRAELIDWMIHARKLGWDLYFNVQSFDVVDSQARQLIGEHVVNCYSSKKLAILRIFPFKFHLGSVYYMMDGGKQKVATWTYRGSQYFNCYDTQQCFSPNYEHGIYSYLSPWHLVGRYHPKTPLSLYIKNLGRNVLKAFIYCSCVVVGFFTRRPWLDVAIENELVKKYTVIQLEN